MEMNEVWHSRGNGHYYQAEAGTVFLSLTPDMAAKLVSAYAVSELEEGRTFTLYRSPSSTHAPVEGTGRFPPQAGDVWLSECDGELTFDGTCSTPDLYRAVTTTGIVEHRGPRAFPDEGGKLKFVRYATPATPPTPAPAASEFGRDLSGNGHDLSPPQVKATPVRGRESYESLMAKLLADEGAVLCVGCGLRPAVTKVGKECGECYLEGGAVVADQRADQDGGPRSRPEAPAWRPSCDIDADIPDVGPF